MTTTRETIMAKATAVMQAHGYNGLSFRELANEVGIRNASIHHHFPTKADLGVAIVRRYREAGMAELAGVRASTPDPAHCLRIYVAGFRAALERDNRMCLCGLLGAEYHELPEPVRGEVQGFVDDNVAWLDDVLRQARPSAEDTRQLAIAIYAAVTGAQLTARSKADPQVYDRITNGYVAAGLIPA